MTTGPGAVGIAGAAGTAGRFTIPTADLASIPGDMAGTARGGAITMPGTIHTFTTTTTTIRIGPGTATTPIIARTMLGETTGTTTKITEEEIVMAATRRKHTPVRVAAERPSTRVIPVL